MRGRLTAAALLLLAAPALAKAPQAPTVADIRQKAEQDEAELRRRAAEAQRDERKEAIDAYGQKKVPFGEWKQLVEMLLDDKTPEVQNYRQPAADALVHRFEQEDVNNPDVRQARVDIALELVPLLTAKSSDERGLVAVNTVMSSWFRPQLLMHRWYPQHKLSDRQKAAKKIKEWLKKEDKSGGK